MPETQVQVTDILRLRDFGLERLDEDRAIVAFAEKAEAKIARWYDFRGGALLFLMAPDDPESGTFYIYDRSASAFYALALPVEGHFGGFTEEEFDEFTKQFNLVSFAKHPGALRTSRVN